MKQGKINEFFAFCVNRNTERKLSDVIMIVELIAGMQFSALDHAKKIYNRDDLEIRKIKIKGIEFID